MTATIASTRVGFEDYLDIARLYADYAQAVDSGDWDLWPEFFVEDCSFSRAFWKFIISCSWRSKYRSPVGRAGRVACETERCCK